MPTLSGAQTPERDTKGADATLAWPPPPHDPNERIVLSRVGDWEIRAFAPGGAKHEYFVRRGFLHLQLWNPERRVSVLTPSRLTLGRYEIFPINGWKLPETDLAEVIALVREQHGLALPSPRRINALEQWFVRAVLRRERRSTAAAKRTGSEPAIQ